jgi:hypothetical protein
MLPAVAVPLVVVVVLLVTGAIGYMLDRSA